MGEPCLRCGFEFHDGDANYLEHECLEMTKENFKEALENKTGCVVQHDGWTCGTCFFAISDALKNSHWRAVLHFRGDYSKEEIEQDPNWSYDLKRDEELLKEVWELIKHE